ncbi:MAG: flagellar hook-associated protein FlgK, partial [Candidatus Dadabacteria bacterium]
AVSALSAQQAIIAATSTNIANVNTEGYTRRVLELKTRISGGSSTSLNIGSGVDIGAVKRVSDEFINKVLRGAISDKFNTSLQSDFLSRLEDVFNLTGDLTTVGTAITDFFSAIDDLSVNPASIELRANMIERGQDLVNAIKTAYNTIASLQTEADNRLVDEIASVNSLTSQIAQLNGLIATRESNGQVAADERDRRDLLLQQLSEKISFDMVETSNGSVTISLKNGFTLVSGTTARELELTASPSFASGSLPPSLEGGVLRYIVFDYGSSGSSAHVDLTQTLKDGSGTIAGLLQVRGYNDPSNTSAFDADGPLVEIASRLEAITRELLTTFNQTYLGPDRDSGTAGHQPSSGDLDGNSPSVYGFFTFDYSGTKDADSNGLPDDLDNLNIDNFSSILDLTSTDPRDIAAALDLSGGPPNAASFAEGDGRNLTALSALQDTSLSFSAGSYSFTGTFNEVYNETVSKVGNLKSKADLDAKLAEDHLTTTQNRRDAFSGVSLDEEFSRLIQFQRVFEANARVIRTAADLLQQIVGIL